METVIKDLKNSIEKLEKKLEKVKRRFGISTEEWQSHPLGMAVMQRDIMTWELEREKRELVVLEFLYKMSKPVKIEPKFDQSQLVEYLKSDLPIEITSWINEIDSLKMTPKEEEGKIK